MHLPHWMHVHCALHWLFLYPWDLYLLWMIVELALGKDELAETFSSHPCAFHLFNGGHLLHSLFVEQLWTPFAAAKHCFVHALQVIWLNIKKQLLGSTNNHIAEDNYKLHTLHLTKMGVGISWWISMLTMASHAEGESSAIWRSELCMDTEMIPMAFSSCQPYSSYHLQRVYCTPWTPLLCIGGLIAAQPPCQ